MNEITRKIRRFADVAGLPILRERILANVSEDIGEINFASGQSIFWQRRDVDQFNFASGNPHGHISDDGSLGNCMRLTKRLPERDIAISQDYPNKIKICLTVEDNGDILGVVLDVSDTNRNGLIWLEKTQDAEHVGKFVDFCRGKVSPQEMLRYLREKLKANWIRDQGK